MKSIAVVAVVVGRGLLRVWELLQSLHWRR